MNDWEDILVKFLERWEGLRLEAYQCSAYVWTIGIGTTVYPDGTDVEPGDVCTMEEAYLYCLDDISHRAAGVKQMVHNESWHDGAKFAALVSLAYNIGTSALSTSTVLKRINDNCAQEDIAEAWSWWNKANGNTVQGLVNRRQAEIELAYS